MYLPGATPDRVYVFSSYAGADKNPAWFFNVVAHPHGPQVENSTVILAPTGASSVTYGLFVPTPLASDCRRRVERAWWRRYRSSAAASKASSTASQPGEVQAFRPKVGTGVASPRLVKAFIAL